MPSVFTALARPRAAVPVFLILALVRPLRRQGPVAGWVGHRGDGDRVRGRAADVVRRPARDRDDLPWLPGDGGPMATVGLMVDELSAPMLVLVSLVSLLVQIYSLAYLHDEPAPSLGRYYTYQSLFAFSMLGLVLSPGYRPDVRLLGAGRPLLVPADRLLVHAAGGGARGREGVLDDQARRPRLRGGDRDAVVRDRHLRVRRAASRWRPSGRCPSRASPPSCSCIYLGAVGKSAQFPLHVWLPDAMEGPTPVSALIHAATMVTAGVFLVARSEPLLVLVARRARAHRARRRLHRAARRDDGVRRERHQARARVLHGLPARIHDGGRGSAGAPDAGFFHLLTHGVFKALLFLGAGAVIHAVGTNDIFRMGGLWRVMPQTGLVFIIGTLALAGVWPLAGFFSKEAVLAGVWDGGHSIAFARAGPHRLPDRVLHVPRRLHHVLRPRRIRTATRIRTTRPG